MHKLTHSQRDDIRNTIDAAGWRQRSFDIDESVPGHTAVVRFSDGRIEGHFKLRVENGPIFGCTYSPGASLHTEKDSTPSWGNFLQMIARWIALLKREASVVERAGDPAPAPDWLEQQQPPHYARTRDQIRSLEAELLMSDKMGRLLWQTGGPLEESVRDVFTSVEIAAELTPPSANFDVTATYDSKERLLMEVTGINGALKMDSNKINQILQVRQTELRTGDRAVVIVNGHRRLFPGSERAARDLVTPEALGLLVGLDAVIVPTSALFELWLDAQTDKAAAKKRLEKIRTAPPGLLQKL